MVNVIPLPSQVQMGQGTFVVTAKTRVVVEANTTANDAAKFLTDRLSAGLGLTLTSGKGDAPAADTILIESKGADSSLGDEGYSLDVTPREIIIRAPHSAGLFYGVQTLLQLMPPAVFGTSAKDGIKCTVPAVHIVDKPRFRWRGLMLDVARHFEPKSAVLQLLDQMAMHKLNVFHWHLTDDQGWRIQIKKYPKLTSIGAWRDKAGFGLSPKLSTTYGPDGKYGGFYTQKDIRQVVAYAAARHIMVVPEIEMPGHASAAKRAYPQYFVPAPPSTDVLGDAGIFNGIYDPANPKTFVFLQNILTEVMDLFPSPYIHIGGDEVPKGPWEHNPADIAFMKKHNLSGGEQLQSYFVKRIEKFVSSKGRHMVGWDEILEGGLAPGAVVMSWRGIEGGRAAANAGHDVVMTPSHFVYLDSEQGHGTEPHERGGLLTVQKVYSYEPVPDGLARNLVHHVLGVQSNLWTEYVPNFPWAEYMIWPRAAAVAESGWTPAADKNWNSFAGRLLIEQKRLDAMRVNYRPLQDDQLTGVIHLNDKGKIVIDPAPDAAGATIRYAFNGDFPRDHSPVYTAPISLPGGWVQICARYFQPGIVATEAAAATFLDGRAVHVTSTLSKDWETRQTSFFTQVYGGGAGSLITVTFKGSPQPIHSITVLTGTDKAPDTRLKQGVLEVSDDGKTFTKVSTFDDGSAHAKLSGKPIVAFRIRIMAMQTPHPNIRQVTIQ